MEQKKNRTEQTPRVKPQAVTIPEVTTPQTRLTAKSRTPTPPQQVPFEKKEYSSPRVEA